MDQIQKETEIFQTPEQAYDYIEEVRGHYTQRHAEYRGQRDELQQVIAEENSERARLVVDGVMAGILALGAAKGLPSGADEVEIGNHKWSDFRNEFERLLVGFGVLTQRLERDGFEVPSFADLPEPDKMKVVSALFSDFLEHNALRFGIDTTGIQRSKRVHNADDGVDIVFYDKDKAKSDFEVRKNISNRTYASGVATHLAGKMSPAKYKRLRREFPEMDKDKFDQFVGFHTDAESALREQNQ